MRHILCAVSAILVLGESGAQSFGPVFESLNSTEEFLKGKCVRNGGGEDAFEILRTQPFELNTCLEPHINYTQIHEEIEESKKTGSMDVVFSKYCTRYPEIYKCLETLYENAKPCLDSTERATASEILNFVPVLKEYMCYNDGIRMALFISQGGFECTDAKREELEACANETMGDRMTQVQLGALPKFWISGKNCIDLFKMRHCVYKELTKCKQNIPANVVDSFFKFLSKYLSCDISEDYLREDSANSDKTVRFIVVAVFLVMVAALIYKLAT